MFQDSGRRTTSIPLGQLSADVNDNNLDVDRRAQAMARLGHNGASPRGDVDLESQGLGPSGGYGLRFDFIRDVCRGFTPDGLAARSGSQIPRASRAIYPSFTVGYGLGNVGVSSPGPTRRSFPLSTAEDAALRYGLLNTS